MTALGVALAGCSSDSSTTGSTDVPGTSGTTAPTGSTVDSAGSQWPMYEGYLPADIATPTGVDESMRRWADHNGCDAEPTEERVSPEVRERTWQHCDAPTVLYVVDNGGHAWPGKPQPAFEAHFGHGTTDIDASTLLFEFFFDRTT